MSPSGLVLGLPERVPREARCVGWPTGPHNQTVRREAIQSVVPGVSRILSEGLQALGLSLSPATVALLAAYAAELTRWNRAINLTGVADERGIVAVHFLDSLAAFREIVRAVSYGNDGECAPGHEGQVARDTRGDDLQRRRARVVDVGSGAGFPGMVIAITQPQLDVTLVESDRRKAAFLDHVRRTLDVANVSVEPERAEVLCKRGLQCQFDLATSRAAARPVAALAYCLPFVRVGGTVALLCGPKCAEDVNGALHEGEDLGSEPSAHDEAEPGRTRTHRHGRTAVRSASVRASSTYDLPWGYGRREVVLVTRMATTSMGI